MIDKKRQSRTEEWFSPSRDCPSHQALFHSLSRRVSAAGPITFAEFMGTVLYHPQYGYYRSGHDQVGLRGDYYTSVSVHPLFGACLADQLGEMWQLVGSPPRFAVVEGGAGAGRLACQILDALQADWPELWRACHYWLVEVAEPTPTIRRTLETRVAEPDRLRFFTRLCDIPGPVAGCVLSNELMDALPVHRVCLRGGRLRELYVGLRAGRLVWIEGQPSTAELERYFEEQGIRLAEGQEAEVNLEARGWIEQASAALALGFVVTLDYGYEALDLYGPRFPKGTLVGYRRHQVQEDPFAALGCQDLTAHVNFTALKRWGEATGLQLTGYTSQSRFLLSLGILDKLAKANQASQIAGYQDAVAAKQLIVPGGMGEIFKVLVQHKGVTSPRLRGLQ